MKKTIVIPITLAVAAVTLLILTKSKERRIQPETEARREQTAVQSLPPIDTSEPAQGKASSSQIAARPVAGAEPLIPNEHLSSGIPLAPVSRELAADLAMRDKQAREAVQKRDLAAGFNADARAAEDALKAASTRLAAGMTPAAVIALLGQPGTVQAFATIGGFRQRTVIPLAIQATANGETYYTYSPFRAVLGDDRHGLSWQVLTVQFDANHQVAKWAWETPIAWRPSMKFTTAAPVGL